MKKLIYVAGGECKGGPGVAKKINNELKAFQLNGIDTKLIFVDEKTKLGKAMPLSSSFAWNKIPTEEADFLYIRWEPVSYPFIQFLKRWKLKNPEIKILMEIGMYPYEDELRKLSNRITILRDNIYKKQLIKYIDQITISTNFKEVFGIPAMELVNCISVDEEYVPERKYYREDSVINIVAVASIAYYYGYDRLIRGLIKYYKGNNLRNRVLFHLVGEGSGLEELKKMCRDNKLEEYVKFYGYKSGKDLDDIYELADIGIDVLGGHRKGDIWFGTLKSREYMCKGLPFVTEYALPENISPIYKYILKVPDDESDIDVQAIVDFFNEIKKEPRETTIRNMRNFAYSYCDISVAMRPVIYYLLED